ncbi:MAG: tetratricopeptide repeat protein [Verrucomicrobiota bacterium]
MKRQLLTSLALLSVAHAEPPPPKAVPVAPAPNAAEIPKAVPVSPAPEPAKQPEPTPAPPSVPVSESAAAPVGAGAPKSERVPAAPLKTAPSPEDVQFDLADALTLQSQWDAAANEYLRFIEQFPASSRVGTAYFRIGEAHQKQGNVNSARLFWGKQLACQQPGPLAGIAAYKLAEFEFQEANYNAALGHYKKALQLIDKPEAKQHLQYFTARCLQLLGRKLEARNAFQPLADEKEIHPYREMSQFQLGLLLDEAGHSNDALARFTLLTETAQTPSIKAESLTRTALLLLKLNDSKKALPALETALSASGTEEWHPLLRLGILQTHAASGQHQKVIETFKSIESQIAQEQLPDVLLLVANAHRQLKQHQEALAVFDKLIELAPKSDPARSCRFDRLICLYNLDTQKLPQEIDAFLADAPSPTDRDNALLMKAEFLRLRGNLTEAAEAYSKAVKSKELKPQRRIDALLRWSECTVRSGNTPQTIEATTQFLASAADHSFAPTALSWRAEANRRSKAFPAAEKDYKLLIEKYPKAEERSSALLQLALLRGEQNDNAGLADLFEKFLKDYPNSPEKAQAHHWIGWAAFEAHDYKKALLHLPEARKLDPEKYQESDSLRLIFCAYNLNDPIGVWKFVEDYLPKGKTKVPADILRWTAQQFIESKTTAKAEPALALLCSGDEAKATDWLVLAQTRIQLNQFDAANAAAEAYLKLVKTPADQALGFIAKSRAELGKGNQSAAQKALEETLRLQPEGRLNAEARLIAGDIQAAKKEWEAAAKLYASVAVFIDDEEITPAALEKAHRAYKEAGKVKEAADTLNRLQSRYPEYARAHLK